jgi:putative ABC transport system permease protein
MSRLSLALKNLSGSAFRSGVVSACALLVSAFALFTTLVMRGAETSLHLAIDRLGADIIVVPQGAEDRVENALLMGAPAEAWMPTERLQQIAALPGVQAASPQLYLATLTGASCCSVSNMFIIAYDPRSDFTVRPWLQRQLGEELRLGEVVGGSFISATEGRQNIRIYGYLVTLRANLEPTGAGLDQSMFMTFDTARDIAGKSAVQAEAPLEIPQDSISAILIKTAPGVDPQALAVRILQTVPNVTPIQSANMFQTYRKQMTGLLAGVLATLAGAWLLSTALIGLVFSMAANERRKELGVLRALGATRRFVFQTLLLEASLLAVMGGAVGVALAALAVFLFRRLIIVSLDLPFLLPSAASLAPQVLAGLLLALITVNLAALIPAMRISRQDPAIAMRE